jgi:uncharacterized protein YdhG (YjbR/CyaY superfamily)
MNLEQYRASLPTPAHQTHMQALMDWMAQQYPQLTLEFKWNTPMYTHEGTFILGVSWAQKHIAIAPERPTMRAFQKRIEALGYTQTQELFRVRLDQSIEWSLLSDIVNTNLAEKAGFTRFWR